MEKGHVRLIRKKTDTREDWLALRKGSVGGSEAAAVMGEHEYADAYTLWCEKRGLVAPFSGNEATRMGVELEDYAARRFCELRGAETGAKVRVRRCRSTLYNPRYPQAHANIDRFITGERALLECKTTSGSIYAQMMAKGEMPRAWYWQLQHYLAVTDFPIAYLIAVDRSGRDKPRVAQVERNEEDIAQLMDAESAFMNAVREGTAPAPAGIERDRMTNLQRWPRGDDAAAQMDLPADWEPRLAERARLKADCTAAEKAVRAIDAELQIAMGDHTAAACGPYRITWKTQVTAGIDRDALRRDHPEIKPEDYRTESRVLRVRAVKG